MGKINDEDLREVMDEEKSRGRRRPADPEARKRRKALLRDLRRLLKYGDEKDFVEAIRALGLKEGSPEFQNALAVWREYRES